MFFLVRRELTMNGKNYAPGEILAGHDVSPVVQQHLERGDARYERILTPLTDAQARERGAEQPRTRIVAPNVNGVHPSELRFAGANPGDSEGFAELGARIAALERSTLARSTAAPRLKPEQPSSRPTGDPPR